LFFHVCFAYVNEIVCDKLNYFNSRDWMCAIENWICNELHKMFSIATSTSLLKKFQIWTVPHYSFVTSCFCANDFFISKNLKSNRSISSNLNIIIKFCSATALISSIKYTYNLVNCFSRMSCICKVILQSSQILC